MSEIAVAIDIGTSRTKVAWRDAAGETHYLDWDGNPFFPSIFHLPAGSDEILLGEDAMEAMEDEFDGYINNLKREIIEGKGVPLTHAERTETAEQLFEALFFKIRKALLVQVAELDGLLPEQVIITVPGQTSSVWRDILLHAANEVGFLNHQVMAEPIAAARGWLMNQEIDEITLVVLDCGGGTTDWSVVEYNNGRITRPLGFKVESIALGGADVDLSLYQYIRSTHNTDSITHYPAPKLINRLKSYKEGVLSDANPKSIRIAGHQLNLDANAVRQVYRNAFIKPLLKSCTPYLEKARAYDNNTGLLVVGNGQNHELIVALKQTFPNLDIATPTVPGLAVISGALALACYKRQLSRNDGAGSQLRNGPEIWEIPDIHGWGSLKVQAWQREVADKLGIPVIQQDRLNDGTQGPEMVLIPPGKYLKGSPSDEPERENYEGPQHQVIIEQPFLLGQCALSFRCYDHYCKAMSEVKPSDNNWGRANHPVINVNLHDAKAYCIWLSLQTGNTYHLPTEAQWEYAARAGTCTPFWCGSTIAFEQANFNGLVTTGLCRNRTVPVKSFAPNPWGLYQMFGNVREWLQDSWNLRGGSWDDLPKWLRSASRESRDNNIRDAFVGFRIARDL